MNAIELIRQERKRNLKQYPSDLEWDADQLAAAADVKHERLRCGGMVNGMIAGKQGRCPVPSRLEALRVDSVSCRRGAKVNSVPSPGKV